MKILAYVTPYQYRLFAKLYEKSNVTKSKLWGHIIANSLCLGGFTPLNTERPESYTLTALAHAEEGSQILDYLLKSRIAKSIDEIVVHRYEISLDPIDPEVIISVIYYLYDSGILEKKLYTYDFDNGYSGSFDVYSVKKKTAIEKKKERLKWFRLKKYERYLRAKNRGKKVEKELRDLSCD